MTVASGQFYFGDLPGKRVSFQSALTQNHHHAWPGGLLAHSMAMLPLVSLLVETVMPDAEDATPLT